MLIISHTSISTSHAISELVGGLLLVVIAILAFSAIYSFVFPLPGADIRCRGSGRGPPSPGSDRSCPRIPHGHTQILTAVLIEKRIRLDTINYQTADFSPLPVGQRHTVYPMNWFSLVHICSAILRQYKESHIAMLTCNKV